MRAIACLLAVAVCAPAASSTPAASPAPAVAGAPSPAAASAPAPTPAPAFAAGAAMAAPLAPAPAAAAAAASALAPAAGPASPAPASVEELLEAKLLARVAAIDAALQGVLGVCAIDLETGHTINYRADTVFPQASSIKIPILIELFRQAKEGRQDLSAQITLTRKDAVPGSGHLQDMLRSHPVTLTVEDLAVAMISASDNTATNKLISMLGMASVNANLDRLGFPRTRLRRIMIDAAAAARNEENVAPPSEMARLAELLYRGKAVDADASRRMVEMLKLSDADFRKVVPAQIAVAAKPGGLTGVHTETGIIYVPGRPFVLSVAGTFLTGDANPVPDIAKLFYEHFATLARSNKYGNGGVH